ncbi:MAG: protein-glutamate O-methyltransferase CheR [Bryobacterales bacterium]|nr:protein-glutamate O-methyltransferase CheR [Bryobacterales bacterium]
MVHPLQPDEWRVLAQYIYSLCGIQLDVSKQYLIESRLSPVVKDTNSSGYSELYYKAKADLSRRIDRQIIDAITTGETSFFRDQTPFHLLRTKLVPDIIENRRALNLSTPIRIWSAASSTGQEAYSIAITIKEALGANTSFDVRIVGTDISDAAISRATRGVYSDIEVERGINPNWVARYFDKHPNGWTVRPHLRSLVSFRKLNLLEDFTFLGQFDLVFCRNVAIYFSPADRSSLFCRIEKALAPGGRVVVGATESLLDVCPALVAKHHQRAVYYERLSAR